MARGERDKTWPRLCDGFDLFAEPALGLGLDVHPIFNPLLVKGCEVAHGCPGRRDIRCRLAQSFDLGPLIGEAQFGDRPNIGLEINPLLLAG